MTSRVSPDKISSTNENECDEGHRATNVKAKVKVKVKEQQKDSEKAARLRDCQSPWSRDTMFTRCRRQRRYNNDLITASSLAANRLLNNKTHRRAVSLP